jgi:predicted ArsR family transcriptional regulator
MTNVDTQATSREAHQSVRHGSHRRIVLAILKAKGPCTDRRLEYWAERLGVSGSSARGRRAELVKMGKVKPSGVVRLPNGRPAIVWRAV